MFAFFRRLGCLAVLVLIALIGWMTRDLWRERLPGQRATRPTVEWEQASAEEERAARARLVELGKESGPVYANLNGGEIAALILGEVSRRYPGAVSDVQGEIGADDVQLEARVDLSRIKELDRLGPLAELLSSRRRVTLVGTPAVRSPGIGELRVASVRIDDVYLPGPVLSAFLARLREESGTVSGEDRTVTFPLPRHVGDIRVSKGAVTLYKRVP
jgi:hypothetical protein